MLRFLGCLALVVATATASAAGTMLFATEASTDGVDGYCVHADGSLDPQPRAHADTRCNATKPDAHMAPSVLLLAPDGRTLLVGQNFCVEFFDVGEGKLHRLGQVPKTSRKGINTRSLAVAADGSMLYVPERKIPRVTAYPLKTEGSNIVPATDDFTSCFTGSTAAGFEQVSLGRTVRDQIVVSHQVPNQPDPVPVQENFFSDTILYATTSDAGIIGTYSVDARGQLVGQCSITSGDTKKDVPCVGTRACDATKATVDKCFSPGEDAAAATAPVVGPECAAAVQKPLTRPRALSGAASFLLAGVGADGVAERMYVHGLTTKRIVGYAFDGADGKHPALGPGLFDTTPDNKGNKRQKPFTRSSSLIRYQQLVRAGDTILGSQFHRARIDGYRVDPTTGKISPDPVGSTKERVRTSPVGMAVLSDAQGTPQVLYVAAGQNDRVEAYHLSDKGLPTDKTPFSATDPIGNAFPNAVTLVDVPGVCE